MGFTPSQIELAQDACCAEGSLRVGIDARALSEMLLIKILERQEAQEAEEKASLEVIRALQEQEHRDALINFHTLDGEAGGRQPAARERQYESKPVDLRGGNALAAGSRAMARAGSFGILESPEASPGKPGIFSRYVTCAVLMALHK